MRAFHDEHGVWPSLREIGDALDIASTNAVHEHLVSLEKKGLVRHRKRCARGWIAVQP
jgi:SOS-response transcriptional repressor LexA